MKALIPVVDGVEDIETVTLIDVLRRAQMDVTVASLGHDLTVTCARNTRIVADEPFKDAAKSEYLLIALPGGAQGAAQLSKNKQLVEKLKNQRDNRKWYAAICAAPALVFAPHGLLDNKRATCYPNFKDQLPRYIDAPVVDDGHCITSQSAATALPFALKIVELVCGADAHAKVVHELVVPEALKQLEAA